MICVFFANASAPVGHPPSVTLRPHLGCSLETLYQAPLGSLGAAGCLSLASPPTGASRRRTPSLAETLCRRSWLPGQEAWRSSSGAAAVGAARAMQAAPVPPDAWKGAYARASAWELSIVPLMRDRLSCAPTPPTMKARRSRAAALPACYTDMEGGKLRGSAKKSVCAQPCYRRTERDREAEEVILRKRDAELESWAGQGS